MKSQWKKVLPNPVLLVLFCIIYIATYKFLPTGVSQYPQVRWATALMRVSILAMGLALHGYYRVRAFHPSFNSAYRQWLCRTPWSIEKPLPNGPTHLIWIDFVILFLATALAYAESYSIVPLENVRLTFVDSSFLIPLPAIAFFAAYLFFLLFSFDFEHFPMPLMIFLLVPFVVYPHRKPYIALIVLIAFYIMLYIALRRYLSNFPWNTRYWKTDQIKLFKRAAIAQRVIGWPFTTLNVFPTLKLPVSGALLLSAFATWWLHVIRWAFRMPCSFELLSVFVCILSLFRALVYVGPFHPPISLWGRLVNRRFIIPGYDKVFLAPICTNESRLEFRVVVLHNVVSYTILASETP